ncbi:glycosyltransferase [Rhodohalobacter sp. 614A]|uniref:glycosyltransferase n=1 Tax=Rhodohalobacter sp. 614A TaxID=2908649 RepID=UPI001F41F23C|nr:glycosyltransferase [Rhodohalobacter sp. 614A]
MSFLKNLNVLVIDLWMPTPDRDSASLRMINLLKILSEKTGKLTFGAGDNPEWRQKHELWRPCSSLNLDLLDGHKTIEAHLEQYSTQYDVIILSRLITANRYFDRIREMAPDAVIIFDTIDLHFLRGYRASKITGNIKLLQTSLLAKRDELSLVKKADCTWVVSTAERKILHEECPGCKIHIVSNIHETYPSSRRFSDRSGILFIGAFSHQPNGDAMNYFHKDIYPLLKKRLPEAGITIIGSDPPEWLKSSSDGHLVVTDYVPDIAPYLHKAKLTIAPLRYGAGVKGKVLLSLGYGVPAVGSSIAAEGITNHEDGMLVADNPEDFCDAVAELYENEKLWNKLSYRGMEIVDRDFSFSAARKSLENSFNSLIAKKSIGEETSDQT